MTNGTLFIQLGEHLVPTDGIRNIHLYATKDTGTPGTMVRVHLHTAPGALYTTPNHLDFTGREAQDIRNWVAKAAVVGTINVIVEAPEQAKTAGKG